jgi:type IV secretion system protein VirB10
VNPNNPNQPGEESGRENPPHEAQPTGADPLANNPYSSQQRQAPSPDLDAGAPTLRSSDLKRMNRRALVFLVAIVLLLVFGAFWLMKSASNRSEAAAPKPRDETVTIPDAPKVAPLPPPMPQPIPIARTPPPMPHPLPPQQLPVQQGPRGPTLLERRMMTGDEAAEGAGALGQYLPGGQTPGQQPGGGMQNPLSGLSGKQRGGPQTGGVGDLPAVSSAEPLTNPDTLMLRGTYIRCVLETHIITDFPGFTSCIVTEPVYSFNGSHLLLPKGSKVMGSYSMEPTGPRVAVIWDRIVTPTGIDVNMASPGIDNLGGAGHPGHYSAHWGSRIGAALLISILSDAFSYEAAEHGPRTTSVSNGVITQTPFQSNTAETLQNLAGRAVEKAANRPATVTIVQGTVLSIYVAKDVDFSGVVSRF